MSDDYRAQDNEVGYGKPPKCRRFKKGVSGNPSGRPKGPSDFGAQVMRELKSKLIITENGKRRAVTKFEVFTKQLVNKAVSGDLRAARLLLPHYEQELEKKAEELRKSPSCLDLAKIDVEDMSTEDLIAFIQADAEPAIRAKLEKSIEANLRKSIRAELYKSIRAELEKDIRAEYERSSKNGAEGRKPRNRRKVGA
jgi:hypothetical protein